MRSIGRHNLRRFAKKSSIGLTKAFPPSCSGSLFFSGWWSIRKLLAFYPLPLRRIGGNVLGNCTVLLDQEECVKRGEIRFEQSANRISDEIKIELEFGGNNSDC